MASGDKWYSVFDAFFFITIGGIIFGALHYGCQSCYRSKCSNVNLCFGLVNLKREVDIEQQIDLQNPEDEEKKDSIKINI